MQAHQRHISPPCFGKMLMLYNALHSVAEFGFWVFVLFFVLAVLPPVAELLKCVSLCQVLKGI